MCEEIIYSKRNIWKLSYLENPSPLSNEWEDKDSKLRFLLHQIPSCQGALEEQRHTEKVQWEDDQL